MTKMLWEIQAPLSIAKAKEDLGVDNIWRYLRYYKMYMARFKWVVGDKDYTNAIEKILFWRGIVCLSYDKIAKKLVVLEVDGDPIVDESGMIVKVSGKGENNYSKKGLVVGKDCIIIRADSTQIPPVLYIWNIANKIVEIEDIIKTQNNMLRKPIVLYGVGEDLDNSLNTMDSVMSGVGVIATKNKKGKTILDEEQVGVLNIEKANSYRGKELWESYNKYEEIIKDYLGYRSVNNAKKERMITDEVNQSNDVCDTFYKDSVSLREDGVKNVNSLFNIDLKLIKNLEGKEEEMKDDSANEMEKFVRDFKG